MCLCSVPAIHGIHFRFLPIVCILVDALSIHESQPGPLWLGLLGLRSSDEQSEHVVSNQQDSALLCPVLDHIDALVKCLDRISDEEDLELAKPLSGRRDSARKQ